MRRRSTPPAWPSSTRCICSAAPRSAARAQTGACRPDGALWDVRGLYVTDASALPGNTGVNPQVTVFANALRIASALAERGPRA